MEDNDFNMLGEAPVSITVKCYYKGFSVLITRRKEKLAPDEASNIIEAIDNLIAKGFEPSWNKATSQEQLNERQISEDIADKVTCPIHNIKMNHYVKGQDEWWSHQTKNGEWCNGRDTKYNKEK